MTGVTASPATAWTGRPGTRSPAAASKVKWSGTAWVAVARKVRIDLNGGSRWPVLTRSVRRLPLAG